MIKKNVIYIALIVLAHADAQVLIPDVIKNNPVYRKYTRDPEYSWYLENALGYFYENNPIYKRVKEAAGFGILKIVASQTIDKNLKNLPPDLLHFLLYDVKDSEGNSINDALKTVPAFSENKKVESIIQMTQDKIDSARAQAPVSVPSIVYADETLFSDDDSVGKNNYCEKIAQNISNIARAIESERYDTVTSADDVISSYKKELEMLEAEREKIKHEGINSVNGQAYNDLGKAMQAVEDQIIADSSELGRSILDTGFKHRSFNESQAKLQEIDGLRSLPAEKIEALRDVVLDRKIDYYTALADLNYNVMQDTRYADQKDYFGEQGDKNMDEKKNALLYKNSFKKRFDDLLHRASLSTKKKILTPYDHHLEDQSYVPLSRALHYQYPRYMNVPFFKNKFSQHLSAWKAYLVSLFSGILKNDQKAVCK